MIGIDEVGRGCWAGPLLVVAARLREGLPLGLADSKILTKKRREQLMTGIEQSFDLGEGWVSALEIDRLGLTDAMKLAVRRALYSLHALIEEEIIMDGNYNYCPVDYLHVQTVIDADALHPIVSAASIYAKVRRDEHMTHQAGRFPAYGFEKHVGYGTAAHAAALRENGVTMLHRRSFAPIRKLVGGGV